MREDEAEHVGRNNNGPGAALQLKYPERLFKENARLSRETWHHQISAR